MGRHTKKRVQLQPTQYRYVSLIRLDADMQAKGATNIALAERAGLSDTTVCRARHRQHLRIFTAECILTALDKYDYQYQRSYSDRPGKNQWTRQDRTP